MSAETIGGKLLGGKNDMKGLSPCRGLTNYQLKLIALVAMTIDHIAVFFWTAIPGGLFDVLRAIGRIAAPIFLYFVVEGVRHTHSRKAFFLRLYVAGAILTGVNRLLEATVAQDTYSGFGNTFPLFMYTVLYIVCLERIRFVKANGAKDGLWAPVLGMCIPFASAGVQLVCSGHFMSGILGTLLRMAVPSVSEIEYSFLFVLLGVAWYFVNDKRYNALMLAGLSALSLLVHSLLGTAPVFWQVFTGGQWLMVLAAPLLLLYNGERGRSDKLFFYAYYPCHQYLLFAISALVM